MDKQTKRFVLNRIAASSAGGSAMAKKNQFLISFMPSNENQPVAQSATGSTPRQNRGTSSCGRFVVYALAALAVITLVLIPISEKTRTTQAHNACINNLRQLEWAKDLWASEKKKSATDTPTWADLIGTDKYMKTKPKCQGGGAYTLGSMGTRPACSINEPEHNLTAFGVPKPYPDPRNGK
jgi:hypothetical protein